MSDLKMIPKKYSGFAIDFKYSSEVESRAIILACTITDIPYRVVHDAKDVKPNEIPVGNIKFIQNVLGYIVKPDYYPLYLSDYFHRKIWYTNNYPRENVFIKPSDEYKRFTGFVIPNGYSDNDVLFDKNLGFAGPFVCSEIINIVDEWRYYICEGEILYSAWYDGVGEPQDAPVLDIKFDKALCCCLDFGMLNNGKLVLIESQHPFSCGWYGRPSSDMCKFYAKWIAYGWEYMSKMLL